MYIKTQSVLHKFMVKNLHFVKLNLNFALHLSFNFLIVPQSLYNISDYMVPQRQSIFSIMLSYMIENKWVFVLKSIIDTVVHYITEIKYLVILYHTYHNIKQ